MREREKKKDNEYVVKMLFRLMDDLSTFVNNHLILLMNLCA